MWLFDDVRYALRSLARARMTTAFLLFSLALGTGANATLFSVMEGLLFRPPAGVAAADRLAWLYTSDFAGSSRGLSSLPDIAAVRESGVFSSLAVLDDSGVESVRLADNGQRVRVAEVSTDFFPTLGMRQLPALVPSPPPGGAAAAIISDTLWTAMGRPHPVIGQVLTIRDTPYTVVAVAPPGFNGLQLGRVCDVWIALPSRDGQDGRGNRRLSAIGRLRSGISLSEADVQVAAVGERLAREHPGTNRGTRFSPDDARRLSVAPYSRLEAAARSQIVLISVVVLGSTGLLLLSACVNAGSLLLSRSAARRRELAVKLALGASRAALVRQVLIESATVSVGGALLGLVFARWTAAVLPVFFAPEEASMLDTRLDALTVGVTLALACVAGGLFAWGPARHALQKVDIQVLRGDAGAIADRSRSTVRAGVVVFQVALSTVLLIASGLLVRALGVALEGDLGPGGRGVVVSLMRMPGVLEDQVARGIVFHNAAIDAIRRQPAVEAAAWVSTLPVGRSTTQVFRLEARPHLVERLEVEVNVASAGYFRTLRIPLTEGRFFNDEDRALSKPVIMVNDILVSRYFGLAAVGRRLADAAGVEYEIVGVVRSGKYRTLQEAPEPMIYFALSQIHQPYMHLVVRTADAAERVSAAVPAVLQGIDRGVTISRTTTLDAHLAEALTLDRILTTVVTTCAAAALLLAMVGVYGVIGDAVRRRTPEIGLRVALGAPSLRILQLVFSEGVPLAAVGSAVGIGAALMLWRLMRSFVHEIPPVDVLSLALVPCALLVLVVGASALPVRRALRVSPTVALRAD